MTNITDKWDNLSFDGKVGFVELRKEQKEMYPDSDYERFVALERAKRNRIRQHTSKLLAMRVS